ncbi:MAG: hypothetical protein AVDCRST_MAG91-2359, partial [uncultured Sphingomonadaceae bacterium]
RSPRPRCSSMRSADETCRPRPAFATRWWSAGPRRRSARA